MKHFLILLALLLLLLPLFKLPARAQPSEGESGKTRSTIYTDEKVANARKNIQRYDWACKMRDNAVQEAEKYLGYGEERLWEMVTPSLSRAVTRSTMNWAPPSPARNSTKSTDTGDGWRTR